MRPARILIVGDETILGLDIKDRLTALGYEVVGLAEGGGDVFAQVEASRPDLVLMDIRLDGPMDGISVAERIRQGWRIPVVYIAASSEDEALQRAQVSESFGCIVKPLDPCKIQTAIEMAIYKHQLEQAAQDSEEKYRHLFAVEPDALLFGDTETLEILDANDAAVRLYGYSREEFLELRVTDLSAEPEATIKAMQEGQERIPRRLHRRKDGRVFPVEISACTFFWRHRRVQFAAVRDITERQKMMEELSKSDARYQRVSRLVSDFAYSCFHAGCGSYEVDWITDAFFTTTGYSREDLAACGCWLFAVHPDDRPLADDQLKVLCPGSSDVREFRIIRKDGSIRWLRNYMQGAEDENDPNLLRLFGAAQDITERKRSEADRLELERRLLHAQKLESLGVLAGGIAHDFNNLLMAILGYADLALLELSPVSPARPNLQEIVNASHRAADLCRQMLAYSGKGRFVIEQMQMSEVVHEMTHMLKTCISKKALLNLNLEHDLPPIEADPGQIRQVIMNLVINASEAMGERSGVITISTGARFCEDEYLGESFLDDELPEGTYVSLEVSDTGCGMDKEIQSRIFEPFFTTKFTGRGLGMSAVLGIVRSHRGAIKVYSEVGKGTTFRLLFPASEWAGDERVGQEAEAPGGWRSRMTILLVDDEEAVRAVGKKMLEKLGVHVLTAVDGREAINTYRSLREEIDCVLLDLTMPHMNGEEAFRELRRMNPRARVIMSSGYSEQEIAPRFSGKGLAGFIQKPYRLANLRDKLKAAMERG